MTSNLPEGQEWDGRDLQAQSDRERDASLREESRIAWAELVCLVCVAAFVVVRALWLT